jgi:hypothetical protein
MILATPGICAEMEGERVGGLERKGGGREGKRKGGRGRDRNIKNGF